MTKPFDTQELCGKLDRSRGYNMNSCSGLPVWPADPRPEDIRIEDIAGGLADICRYGGQMKWEWQKVPADVYYWLNAQGAEVRIIRSHRWKDVYEVYQPRWYSVAQHSVLVEQYVRGALPGHPDATRGEANDTKSISFKYRDLYLAALLHDSPEYVLGDFVKPQKTMYAELPRYNRAWEVTIAERFGFDVNLFDHPAIKEADYRIFLTEKRDLVVNGTTDFGVAKAEPYPERIVPVLPSAARKMFMDRFNQLYKGD